MVKKEAKTFFRNRTAKEIEDSCDTVTVTKDFVNNIISSIEYNNLKSEDEKEKGLVFEFERGSFIPKGYKGARDFAKKGPLLILDSYNHVNDAIDANPSIQDAVIEKINSFNSAMLSGVGFFPLSKDRYGNHAQDTMMRKFRLTSCSNAIQTINYILNHGQIIHPNKDKVKDMKGIEFHSIDSKTRGKASVEIKSYSLMDNLAFEGGIFKGSISSRTKGNLPYAIVASNIPIASNVGNQINARKYSSNHSSKEKLYGRISYTSGNMRRPSDVINCYSQDISFYLACALFMEEAYGSTAARDYNPFLVLSENLVKVDNFLAKNCLVKTTESKAKRGLSQMERERGLWGIVKDMKFDYSFTVGAPVRDLKDYDLGRSYRK